MKLVIYSIMFLFLMSCSNTSTQNTPSLILGKWVGDSTIQTYYDDTLHVTANELQMIIKIDSLSWGFIKSKGYEVFPYKVTNDYLTINKEKMELIKLSNSHLIYKRSLGEEGLFDIDIFRKVEGTDW